MPRTAGVHQAPDRAAAGLPDPAPQPVPDRRSTTAQLDVRDVTWINANGGEMQQPDWDSASIKCFGMLLDGRARKTGCPGTARTRPC